MCHSLFIVIFAYFIGILAEIILIVVLYAFVSRGHFVLKCIEVHQGVEGQKMDSGGNNSDIDK